MSEGKTVTVPPVNPRRVTTGIRARFRPYPTALPDHQSLAYIRLMHIFLLVLLGADMIAVIAVLLTGAVGMTSANANPRRQNTLMRWRVGLQAVAIILVVILLLGSYH
jgi:hypothetical protein